MRFNKSSSAPYSGGNYGDHCKDGGRSRRTKLPSDPYLDFPRPRSGSTQPHPATIAEQRCPASDLVCASSFQLQPDKRPEKNSLLNSAPTHECPGRPQTSGFNFRRRGRVWEGEWVEGSVRKGFGTDVSNFLGTGGGGGGYSFSQAPPRAN